MAVDLGPHAQCPQAELIDVEFAQRLSGKTLVHSPPSAMSQITLPLLHHQPHYGVFL